MAFPEDPFLELYLPFTGNYTDQSGNSVTTSTAAAPDLTTDKNGVSNQAYDFEKDNSDYIWSAYTPDGGAMSVSGWVYLESYYGTETFFGSSDASANPFAVYTGTSRKFSFAIQTQSGESKIATTVATYGGSTWYHVCAVYTGGTSRELYLYVNGSVAASAVRDNAWTAGGGFTFGQFNVGRYGNYNGLFLDGKCDEVRVYSRGLTQEEVTTLYEGYDSFGVASGYSKKVLGVTPSKVNGVAKANISKVNGV